jgi:hypothetical protein
MNFHENKGKNQMKMLLVCISLYSHDNFVVLLEIEIRKFH